MESTTKQFRKRNAILSCLQQTKTHPSAEMVLEMLSDEHPDISLATVYRNLTWFKNHGMVSSLGTVSGIERFDANTEPHVHFICTGCDAVIDLPQVQVPLQLGNEAEDSVGCHIEGCQLTFTGQCSACVAKSAGETA